MSEYDKNRCYQTLDEKGGYYCRHTRALTAEDLRGKHEIAAELGYRDSVIDDLKKQLEMLRRNHLNLKDVIAYVKEEECYRQIDSERFIAWLKEKDKINPTESGE